MIIFPYLSADKKQFFPLLTVKIGSGKQAVDTIALIDSGAAISIFKDVVAEQLGITIEKGKHIVLNGVGGRIIGYIHTMQLAVANKTLQCPVVFSREYAASFNILGREVFFKQFTITFEEKHQLVKLV